ncbi:hypothetical protein D3C76_1260070 [compost metagenome]
MADTFGHQNRLLLIGLLEQAGKLFSTDTTEHIVSAQMTCQNSTECDQRLIPRRMAEAVIQTLEVIKVAQQ